MFVTKLAKQNIKFLNKNYVINLVGNKQDVEQASQEIYEIAKSQGLTTKFISVKPYICLAHSQTNSMPEWRIKLSNELVNSQEQIIINKIGPANYEAVNELNRSIRALTYDTIHPWAFLIDPNVSSRHDSDLLDKSIQMYGYTNPFNQVYPLKASMDEKKNELETYFG